MRRRDFRDGAVNFSHGDRTRRPANDGVLRQLLAVAADVDIMAAPVDRVDDHILAVGMLIRQAPADPPSDARLGATFGRLVHGVICPRTLPPARPHSPIARAADVAPPAPPPSARLTL